MYVVTIWTLIYIPFLASMFLEGMWMPLTVSMLAITITGLIGFIWQLIQADFAIQIQIHALALILLMIMWAAKKIVLPKKNIKDSRIEIQNTSLHPIKIPQMIYYVIMVAMIIKLVFIHITTQFSHTNFLWSFTVGCWAYIALYALVNWLLFAYLKKMDKEGERSKFLPEGTLAPGADYHHILFMSAQNVFMYFAVLIGYWVFFHTVGMNQSLSMLIGLAVFAVLEATLVTVMTVGFGRKGKKEKNDDDEDDIELLENQY